MKRMKAFFVVGKDLNFDFSSFSNVSKAKQTQLKEQIRELFFNSAETFAPISNPSKFGGSMSNEDSTQFREFIQRLQREDNRPAALAELKNLLIYKPPGEAVNAIRDVGISRIFLCLNDQDKAHVDLTCDVLRLCFEKFEVGDVVRLYTGNIMFLLRHEKACVRRLALEEVHKATVANADILPIPQYIDVFVAVAQLVADDNVGIANMAITVTSHLPVEAYPKVLDEMKIALDGSSSSKCNALEVIVNISTSNPQLLQLSSDLGYIEFMLSELTTEDVLYQMNLLELLSRLAGAPHGTAHLVGCGALDRVTELVEVLQRNPLSSVLIPGYLKLLGCLAHAHPRETFVRYPVLVGALFSALEAAAPAVLPVALDTLGFIGASVEGKLSLAALGSKYTQAVERIGQLIRTSTTDIKVRSLQCAADLIGYEQDPSAPQTGPIDHRVTLMTREWFRSLSQKPEAMAMLHEICKNPFPEIKLSALRLLDAACQHQWGQELVARTPGFTEYLLDRSAEHTKECKEAKYDVVRRLSRSAAFEAATLLRFAAYVEQGPFHAQAALQVAMDDGE